MNDLGSRIFITLATHNGERFLAEQLDSLFDQTETGWTLLVRDDQSTDKTAAIVEEYARRDDRIRVLQSPPSRLGTAGRNFAGLLEEAFEHGADYVFCCDQDDVWAPDKLARMLDEVRRIEGPDHRPSLVHHDLAVVDERLEPLAASYWSMMALSPADEKNPQRLLSRNEVTGCAMACNRALLEIALPVPDEAIMHDWWLALFAAYFGKLGFMPQQLVQYRQHGENVIGAKSFWRGLLPFQNWFNTWRSGNAEFLETVKQARTFRSALAGRIEQDSEERMILDAYCDLTRSGRVERLALLKRCGVWRHQWLLDTVLVLRMLLLPRENV